MRDALPARLPSRLMWLVPFEYLEITSSLTPPQIENRLRRAIDRVQPFSIENGNRVAVGGILSRNTFKLFPLYVSDENDANPVAHFAPIHGEFSGVAQGTLIRVTVPPHRILLLLYFLIPLAAVSINSVLDSLALGFVIGIVFIHLLVLALFKLDSTNSMCLVRHLIPSGKKSTQIKRG